MTGAQLFKLTQISTFNKDKFKVDKNNLTKPD